MSDDLRPVASYSKKDFRNELKVFQENISKDASANENEFLDAFFNNFYLRFPGNTNREGDDRLKKDVDVVIGQCGFSSEEVKKKISRLHKLRKKFCEALKSPKGEPEARQKLVVYRNGMNAMLTKLYIAMRNLDYSHEDLTS